MLIEGLPEGVTDEGAAAHNVERCPSCQRAMDDFETMTEAQLLDHLRAELLRDLARGFRNSTITHQEKAVLVRMLKDNNSKVPEPDDLDDGLEDVPERNGKTPLPQTDYSNTDGG